MRGVDRREDRRRARAHFEIRVRVRPPHDARAIDQKERGYGDLVMRCPE
jgi:hypothetical protein